MIAGRAESVAESKAPRNNLKSDKRKVNEILRMCVNDDYKKAMEADCRKSRYNRSNKASFANMPNSSKEPDEDEDDVNNVNLAFRKKA